MNKSFWILLLFTLPAFADNGQACDSETVEAVARWVGDEFLCRPFCIPVQLKNAGIVQRMPLVKQSK